MTWIPYSPEVAEDFTGVPAEELRDRYGDTIWVRRTWGGIEIKPTLPRHRILAEVTSILAAGRRHPAYPPVGDPKSSQVTGSPYLPKESS